MISRRLRPILPIALTALLVGACGKAPLVPDAPKGAAQWLRNVALACTTSTTDPSDAQVSYQFDWGDGNKSQWSQFMNGGAAFSDTHSYADLGSFAIRVRAKNAKKASGWSAPLNINVVPGEGIVAWSIDFTNPDDIEDSSDFTLNSFAIGSDNTAYIACDYGAVIARRLSGSSWKYLLPDIDQFTAAPLLADDGTILVGCSNEFIYALKSDGTLKWADSVGDPVYATGALGSDGTAYFQTSDSMVIALRSDGTQLWTFFSQGGNSAPVVGADGTVYAVNQNGTVFALDPSNGNQKWMTNLNAPAEQAPAIDASRNLMYVVTDAGLLQSIDLTNGTGGSLQFNAGTDASGPVVGADGTIYVGGNGKLTAVSPDGTSKWVYTPALTGVVSTPAITVDGYVYVLVVAGKKRLALQSTDSLYAVSPDGTQRWACGLGEGLSDAAYQLSAPKLDASGFIYVGDGHHGWCVAGVSAPAQSIWPMFQRDAQNTGRAR